MSVQSELGSMSSTITALLDRVAEVLSELPGGEDHEMAPALHDVERSLRTAGRRIERSLRDSS